jgi:hypothetical protein
MKKFSRILLISILGLFLVAGSAMAVPFNDRDPQIVINGPFGSEDGVQTILDNILDPDSINAATDQQEAALWTSSDVGASSAFTLATFTTMGGTLGIYNAAGVQVDLGNFSMGPNPVTSSDTLPGVPWISFLATDSLLKANGNVYAGDWEVFGFYWTDISGKDYFTEDDKNGGIAKALVYAVEEGTTVDYSYYWENSLSPDVATGNDDWIIAFDNGTNGDFNDGVFYMKDMNPVPEPATMLLLGAGLLGLAGLGRRKFFKKE